MSFYVVRKGKIPGIFNTWEECKTQIFGFSKAQYKKFSNKEEAQLWLDGISLNSSTTKPTTTKPTSSTPLLNSEPLIKYDQIIHVDGSWDKDHDIATSSVFFGVDNPRNCVDVVPGLPTSPRSELWAVFLALCKIQEDQLSIPSDENKSATIDISQPLSQPPQPLQYLIRTDCMYAINTSLKNIQAIENLDLIQPIWEKIEKLKSEHKIVNIEYVPGHSNHFGNEMAHKMAYNHMKQLRDKKIKS